MAQLDITVKFEYLYPAFSWLCYLHICFILFCTCVHVIKGAARSVNTNGESRVFWLSLVVAQVFWVVFVFAALITLSFKWLVSDDLFFQSNRSLFLCCSLHAGIPQWWYTTTLWSIKKVPLLFLWIALWNIGLF